MGGYANFIKRMNAGGNTMRTEQIENSIRQVVQTFADDPSYVPEGASIINTDRIIYPRIYEEKYRSTSPAHAKIMTKNCDPFYMGDVINWPNHGNWLCLNVNNLHGIQYEGTLAYCNYTIKFKSPLNGEILSYPVSLINATQYGSGETDKFDDKLRMTVGTSQLIVYITFDEHTCLLDNGVRFLIDRNPKHPTAFRITQADSVSYSDGNDHGYICLTVYEDQFNPKLDDIHEMVADYRDNFPNTLPEIHDDNENWL